MPILDELKKKANGKADGANNIAEAIAQMDFSEGSVTPEEIAESVSAYLDEHLTNPTNPPIDTSLSIAGAAADAKATGDKLSELKEELNNSIIPSAWISDKFVNHTNGREYDSTAYKHTGKIFIGGANFVFIRAKVAGNAGYAFYTDAKEYISGGLTSESAITQIIVPSNAVYIDVSNNASYNTPVINLDSYGRTVSSGFKTELIGNYSDGTITINTDEYTSGYIAKYSDRDTITIVESTAYMHSGLVPIIGGQKILVHNVTPAYGYALHFLNSSQMWVGGVANTNTGIEQADVYAETPINAVYMMFNKLASSSITQSAEYLVGVKNGVIADTLIPSWYNSSHQKMTTLFGNATKKLIATIVDDDTMTTADVLRFKSYLDQANIKGTLATLTFNWTRDSNLENTLLSMEREGHQVVLHAFSQISDFEHPTTDAQFEACEDNFIRGLRDVKMAGFCNPDFWVTPYGSDEERLQRMAKRCGLKALVSTHNTYNGTDGSKGRYNLNRCAFAESDGAGSITDVQLKSIAAEAATNDGWLILMTHFATWGDSTAEVARFNDMINYIKGLGFEFMTLGEAWEIRKPIYDINDMF